VWDHETAVEFLRARSVLSRKKVAELVENKELREMKGILTVKVENNEEKGVVVKKRWLDQVGSSRKVSAAVDEAFQSLISMRAEGEISSDCRCPQCVGCEMIVMYLQPKDVVRIICMCRPLGLMASRYWIWSTRVMMGREL